MRANQTRAIVPLMRYSVIIVIGLASVLVSIFCFTYDLVHDYQHKTDHVKQISELLASSASSPQGVDLVADQVSNLLNNDPTLKNIIFYSVDHPFIKQQISQGDWQDALFADDITIHQAVTSRYLGDELNPDQPSQTTVKSNIAETSLNDDELNDDKVQTKRVSSDDEVITKNNTLLGYISITVDVAKFRSAWIIEYQYLWIVFVLFAPISAYLIIRTLNQPLEQIVSLATASEETVQNPELVQLPVIYQNVEFKEVRSIKSAMIVLFNRINDLKIEYDKLKQYEQKLRNKDMSLDIRQDNFQSMITHEIKTSLNAIFGGLQLLNNHYLSNEQQDALSVIRKGSQHLDFTLEQIIQLNRIEKGQVGLNNIEFNPLQLISDLIQEYLPMAQAKGLQLISQITHVDYRLKGDVSKIKLILSALIDNAIKFTNKGKILIESHLNHFSNHTRWQISVLDSGIGIETKYFEDIFTPFFQIDPAINTQSEGVGIGLSLAKQMANLLNASLDVSSQQNQGTKFILTLQLEDWRQNAQQTSFKNITALNYHQEGSNQIVENLQMYGLNVQAFHHSQSILEKIEEGAFDLLIISEDVAPNKASYLVKRIRQIETTARILIIYLYADQIKLAAIEDDLKTAGVDYLLDATAKTKHIADQLKEGLLN